MCVCVCVCVCVCAEINKVICLEGVRCMLGGGFGKGKKKEEEAVVGVGGR